LPNGRAFEITYYSDASKTQVVGERIHHCGGNFYAIGETSEYFHDLDLEPCNDGPVDPWWNKKSPVGQ